jgi:hypothetical protein
VAALVAVATPFSSAAAPVGQPPSTFAVNVYGLSPVEGQFMNRVNVGSFTDIACIPAFFNDIRMYTGTIDWGDGTTSQAVFGGDCNLTLVQGSHTYADEMTNIHLAVNVTATPQPPLFFGSVHTGFGLGQNFSVAEGDVFIAAGGGTLSVNEGTALSNVQLGVFTNTGYPLNPATGFLATIDWGDGTAVDTTGSLIGIGANNTSPYILRGTHTYRKEGTYTAKATLTDKAPGTATVSATTTVTVADVDRLTGTPVAISATPGQSFTGPVATFTDSYTGAIPADFTATIDWGDGSGVVTNTSAGTITSSNGVFTVTGTHMYQSGGSSAPRQVVVKVSHNGTVALTVNSTAGGTLAGGSSAAGGNSVGTAPAQVTPPSTGGGSTTGTGNGASTTGTGSGSGTPAGGTTGTTPPAIPLSAAVAGTFVQHLYVDLLNRPPSDTEASTAVASLTATTNGQSPSQLALTLLATSEYQGDLVAALYNRYLGRSPSGDEVEAAVSALRSSDPTAHMSDEGLMATILGSDEYFTAVGGTNDAFLASVYDALLGRAPSDAVMSATLLSLTNGTLTRSTVASTLLGGGEYRTVLTNRFYLRFLGRDATDDEKAAGSAVLAGVGGTDEQLIALIVASPEYLAKS